MWYPVLQKADLFQPVHYAAIQYRDNIDHWLFVMIICPDIRERQSAVMHYIQFVPKLPIACKLHYPQIVGGDD